MSNGNAKGSCLCGEVQYQISGNLGIFQYCHCSRCRKFTGSTNASNLIVSTEQFKWMSGESRVGKFLPENTRYFSTAFCQQCGSSLPWESKNGKVIIIPAGTLDEHPGIEPSQNIFCGSKAEWYQSASELPKHEELPLKKK